MWGTVCDDSFGTVDAQAACRALGYSRYALRATVVTSVSPASSSTPIYMDEVSCRSGVSFRYCSYSARHNCGHSEDVGVRCPTSSSYAGADDGDDDDDGGGSKVWIIGPVMGGFVVLVVVWNSLRNKQRAATAGGDTSHVGLVGPSGGGGDDGTCTEPQCHNMAKGGCPMKRCGAHCGGCAVHEAKTAAPMGGGANPSNPAAQALIMQMHQRGNHAAAARLLGALQQQHVRSQVTASAAAHGASLGGGGDGVVGGSLQANFGGAAAPIGHAPVTAAVGSGGRKAAKRAHKAVREYPHAPSIKPDDSIVRAMECMPHAFDPPPPPARVNMMPFEPIPVGNSLIFGEVRDGAVIYPAGTTRPVQAGLKTRSAGGAGVVRNH